MELVVERFSLPKSKVELVERKGLGHPDYMADSFAEYFSRHLCRYYLKHFDAILHHNVDKLEVVGGQAKVKFGGGKITRKILLFYSGRATSKVEDEEIPLDKIAKKSAKDFLQKFRFLRIDHFKFLVATKGGAGNLVDIFKRKVIGANDTSIGSAFWPLTKLESVVYELERFANSRKFKRRHPYSGEDVKVMGVRIGKKFHFTTAVAFIDKFIGDTKEYISAKEAVYSEIKDWLSSKIDEFELFLNTLDKPERGIDGCYLTVTGSSAEMGDDGSVGRGNRVMGIIPYNRPISLEATAGKNPVSHIGKIYNVVALNVAKRIHEELGSAAHVWLLSQIGRDVKDPWVAKVNTNAPMRKVRVIVEEELERIPKLTKDFVKGKIEVF